MSNALIKMIDNWHLNPRTLESWNPLLQPNWRRTKYTNSMERKSFHGFALLAPLVEGSGHLAPDLVSITAIKARF